VVSNQVTKRCVFCEVGKVTKEHAIAESWGSILDGGMSDIPGHTLWYLHRVFEPVGGGSSRDTILLSEKRAKTPAFISRKFCRGCQGSWMRKLDESVRDVVTLLTPIKSFAIPADTQHTLACWAVKTMLVFLSMEPEERQREFGVTEDFARFGQTHEPLAGTHVWIAVSQHDQPGWFRSISMELHPPGGPSGRAYAAGLGVRNLFVVVIVPSSPDFLIRLGPDQPLAMRRIWPPRSTPLRWPPSVQITTPNLDAVLDAQTRSTLVSTRR
jgi:hypothetical protein